MKEKEYTVAMSFHRGNRTEVKTFYVEGVMADLYAFEKEKLSQGWTSCGVLTISCQKSPPPEMYSGDFR